MARERVLIVEDEVDILIMADLATNVAEDVVFMVEGGVIRHRAGELSLGEQ